MDPVLVIAALVLIGNGVALATLGAARARRTRHFLVRAVGAHGIVVGLQMVHGRYGGVYVPRIEFATPGGGAATFVDDWGSNPPRFRIGDAVDVRYDPARPDDARIDTQFGLWRTAVLLVGLGCTSLLCAGVLLIIALTS